jgi:hypothetical protein
MVQWSMWTRLTPRDIVGLALGSVLLLHETLLAARPRELIVIAALACLAGTFALRADERDK